MSKITVEVILPFHSDDDLLAQAIRSCLNSEGINVKLILIDTRKHRTLIAYPDTEIISLPGGTYMQALARGIRSSSAEIIAIMNSDDLISKDRLYKQAILLINSGSDLSTCGIRKFAGRNRRLIPGLLGTLTYPEVNPHTLLLGPYGTDATWVFRREWAVDNEVFCLPTDINDYATGLRVIPNSKVSKISEQLYFYRMHRLQVSRKIDKWEFPYTQWRKLNAKLGLPALTDDEILAMAAPWKAGKKVLKVNNLMDWLRCVREQIGQNSHLKSEIEILLARRIILSFNKKLILKNWKLCFSALPRFIWDVLLANRFIRF
jgi:hypothetical protein